MSKAVEHDCAFERSVLVEGRDDPMAQWPNNTVYLQKK